MAIEFYDCKDCGMVLSMNVSMRPNGKFCNLLCMEHVKKHRLAKGDGNDWYNDKGWYNNNQK